MIHNNLRHKLSFAIIAAIICCTGLPASTSIANATNTSTFPSTTATVVKKSTVTSGKNVVLIDSTTNQSFIPLRFVSEFANANIALISSENKIEITREEMKLTMYTDRKTAYINDQMETLKQSSFVDNGTTYVPLQWVSKPLGVSFQLNSTTSTIEMTYQENSTILPYVTHGSLKNFPISSQTKTFKVGSKSFSTQMVTVSLMHPKISLDVALAGDTIGNVEDLSSLAKRNKAYVAINGTFFDAYTKNAYKAPYGYIVSQGDMKKNSSGDKRTVFTYDTNLRTSLLTGWLEFMEKYDQGEIYGGLQAGPRLVVDGKVSIDVKGEGFKDPKILTGGGARSALGITRDHKLILITTGGATIPQLAEIMKQAGAYQAMNLDGGASSGLYYNGKYLTTPGRKISNALVVKYQ